MTPRKFLTFDYVPSKFLESKETSMHNFLMFVPILLISTSCIATEIIKIPLKNKDGVS